MRDRESERENSKTLVRSQRFSHHKLTSRTPHDGVWISCIWALESVSLASYSLVLAFVHVLITPLKCYVSFSWGL